jgi:hypothetical protein
MPADAFHINRPERFALTKGAGRSVSGRAGLVFAIGQIESQVTRSMRWAGISISAWNELFMIILLTKGALAPDLTASVS